MQSPSPFYPNSKPDRPPPCAVHNPHSGRHQSSTSFLAHLLRPQGVARFIEPQTPYVVATYHKHPSPVLRCSPEIKRRRLNSAEEGQQIQGKFLLWLSSLKKRQCYKSKGALDYVTCKCT